MSVGHPTIEIRIQSCICRRNSFRKLLKPYMALSPRHGSRSDPQTLKISLYSLSWTPGLHVSWRRVKPTELLVVSEPPCIRSRNTTTNWSSVKIQKQQTLLHKLRLDSKGLYLYSLQSPVKIGLGLDASSSIFLRNSSAKHLGFAV